MNFQSPEEANKLLCEYRSEYNNLDSHYGIDMERKKILRNEVYNIELWLKNWSETKCENHKEYDIDIFNQYDLFVYKNCDRNGNCKKCGVRFRFYDDVGIYKNIKKPNNDSEFGSPDEEDEDEEDENEEEDENDEEDEINKIV